MRYAILLVLASTFLLMEGACAPLFELKGDHVTSVFDSGTDVLGDTLSVAVNTPSVDREIPLGMVVDIEWTASNRTGTDAIATILVRARADFTETILAGGLRLPEIGGVRTLAWDTNGFLGGEYEVIGRIEAGMQSEQATAAGRITINTPPEFEFTEPIEDTTLGADPNDPNDPNGVPTTPTVTIRWTAFDPDGDGTLQIGIDPDLDHGSDNEVIIAERDIPGTSSGVESIDWDGTDRDGARVAADTYNLYAIVSDSINDPQTIDGLARITVPEEPNEPEPVELAITDPNEDSFLTPGDSLTIRFTLDEEDDVLASVEMDPDDDHSNGNEIPILSDTLIETDTKEYSFDWKGKDVDNQDVAQGIYRLVLLINRGTASTPTVESDSLVYWRDDEDNALIGLLKPDGDVSVSSGTDVFVKWRDHDPDENAEIRLTLDDDDIPDQNEAPGGEDAPEVPIAEGIQAAGDGVQDTYNIRYYQLKDLKPGRYYLFAYIQREGQSDPDMISVAGGAVQIQDPNTP